MTYTMCLHCMRSSRETLPCSSFVLLKLLTFTVNFVVVQGRMLSQCQIVPWATKSSESCEMKRTYYTKSGSLLNRV